MQSIKNKNEQEAPAVCSPVAAAQPPAVVEDKPEPMEVDEPVAEAPRPTTQKPKKKKKKASYKNMMATVMKSSSTRDVEQEKASLRNVVGGGQFSKIEKI